MKNSEILLCIVVLACLAFQAGATSESQNNSLGTNRSNNTKIFNESDKINVSSGLNIALGTSESNDTKVSNSSDKTKVSSIGPPTGELLTDCIKVPTGLATTYCAQLVPPRTKRSLVPDGFVDTYWLYGIAWPVP
jgi:hypothetical protein